MALTNLPAAIAATMIQAITTTGLFISIHSAAPGPTGANELVGGTAYTGTRPAVTWGAITAGVILSTNSQTYPMLVLQATGVPDFGIWTAASGGTYLGGGAISGASGSVAVGASLVIGSISITVSG